MLVLDLYDAVLVTISGVSLLCQFYTLALIIRVTPKSMFEYRMFLLMYTVSQILRSMGAPGHASVRFLMSNVLFQI